MADADLAFELVEGMDSSLSVIGQEFFGGNKLSAFSFMVFNLLCAPCFAAMGAMNSEMKSAKWLWGGIGFQLGTGFTIGYLVYQIGTLITTGSFGEGFVPGLVAVAAFIAILVALCINSDKKIKKEYELKGNKTPVSAKK